MFQVPFSIGPVELEFIPAGHMLGSAQVLMRYQGQTVLYTGDLSLRPNPTCEPLQAPTEPIDLLISESTFAAKDRHADPATALRQTISAAGYKPLMIAVYPLGKAQHVTHLLTEEFPDLRVLVHFDIFRYHLVYEAHGFQPGKYQHYRRQDKRSMLLPHAYLVTPKVMAGYSKDYNYHKVMASGWLAKERFPYLDGNLDISDHVDAMDIQAYLVQVKPKQVWFWHGSPGPLLEWCGKAGIDAKEIKRGEKVEIEEAEAE
jgi:putative mRNA 3-end processing factor